MGAVGVVDDDRLDGAHDGQLDVAERVAGLAAPRGCVVDDAGEVGGGGPDLEDLVERRVRRGVVGDVGQRGGETISHDR